MQDLASHGILLIDIAVLFLAVAIRDYWLAEQKMTPTRSTYMRVVFIFAAVSIVLQFAGWFFS